jgi:hypothetical protein
MGLIFHKAQRSTAKKKRSVVYALRHTRSDESMGFAVAEAKALRRHKRHGYKPCRWNTSRLEVFALSNSGPPVLVQNADEDQ